MPFYVPVGPRGVLLRFGTLMIGILGSLTYWRATRRRRYPALTFEHDFDWSDI